MEINIELTYIFAGIKNTVKTKIYQEYAQEWYCTGIIMKRRVLRTLIISKVTKLAVSDINANKVNITAWKRI